MALPTSYTEDTLKTFMLATLSGLGSVLGLTTTSFSEAVNDVLIAYGVSDIAQATDISKLRALAKVAAWRVAVATASGDYDFSADGGSYKRSQIQAQVLKGLAVAESDAAEYAAFNEATVGVMVWEDPYQAVEIE